MRNGMIRCGAALVLTLLTATGWASQFENRTLISPIVRKPFEVVLVPPGSSPGEVLATDNAEPDMGIDEDGCRHSSGLSEYDLYIATDPYTYFSALSIEWDRTGRFRGFMPNDMADWLTGPDGFNDEWVTDKNRTYKRALRIARAQGQPMPPIEEWVMPQDYIPIEKRYRFALTCYQRRSATQGFLAKVALSGAWALRVRLNRPLVHTMLAGGIQEVNDRLERYVEEGDGFDRDRFAEAYRRIFRSGGLTDEGYFIAGTVDLGFQLRQGNQAAVAEILDRLRERFEGVEDGEVLRGMVRERQTMVREYVGFLTTAIIHFTVAIANEEFARTRMPEVMFVAAESMRRIGDLERSYDWFLTLSRMEETQPRSRAEIRSSGGVPSIDAPQAMLLGWRADEMLAKLEAAGVEARDDVRPNDREILDAIRIEGLGTMDYVSPSWTPTTGAEAGALIAIMRELGKASIEFRHHTGGWPASLGEMWLLGAIRDRNRYNRFCCPVTGDPLVYHAPIGQDIAPDLVLLSSPEAVETDSGRRYIGFTAGLQVVYSEEPFARRAGDAAP